jgi:ADP-ribose pyrophosphatase YjhB (NUDIX family)
MKQSCGAILYAINPIGEIGVILGLESNSYLPFKGCNEAGETLEQTAIREIKEETCNVVSVDDINLNHSFRTKAKTYHIGLLKVDYNIIKDVNDKIKQETKKELVEKKEVKFFSLKDVLQDYTVHNLTKASIRFYWNSILYGVENRDKYTMRCHGVPVNYAIMLKKLHEIKLYGKVI